MTKKSIPAIIIIFIGILLLFNTLLQNNTSIYPEEIFTQESKAFNSSFDKFIQSFEKSISEIRNNFSDTNKIKNVSNTEKFFLNFIKENPFIISSVFVQNNNKIVIQKSDNSFIIAFDSTSKVDVLNWKRFKKGKQISSWDESYSSTIGQSKWYKGLFNNPNTINWYFNTNNKKNVAQTKDNELFYAAYPYYNNGVSNLILIRFSRLGLLKVFNTYSKYDKVNLLVQTSDNKNMNLSSGLTQLFENIDNDSLPIDSFRITTIKHFLKFGKQNYGIFNFKYKNDIIWNSFRKFDKALGINFYILSIPNTDIITSQKYELFSSIPLWVSFLILIIGILYGIFILRKNHRIPNYKPSELASCNEILKEDESRVLEFKSSLRWDYRQEKVNPDLEKVIFKTIAAFGNTDGGILLIGVDDDKNILGLESDFKTLKKANSDFFEIHLRNLLHTQMGVKYVSSNIRMQFEEVEPKKIVCKIQINAANEALFLKIKDKNGNTTEKFYVRSGNSSHEIKSIAEINDYINSRFK